MSHRRVASRSQTAASASTTISRNRRPADLDVVGAGSAAGTARTLSTHGSASALGAEASALLAVVKFQPDPTPSPSKLLDHPTYAPGSHLRTQQVSAPTAAFSTAASFSSSRPPFDELSDSDDSSNFPSPCATRIANDDATDCMLIAPPLRPYASAPPLPFDPEEWKLESTGGDGDAPKPSLPSTPAALSTFSMPQRASTGSFGIPDGSLGTGTQRPPSPGLGTLLSWAWVPSFPKRGGTSNGGHLSRHGPRRSRPLLLLVLLSGTLSILLHHYYRSSSLSDLIHLPTVYTGSSPPPNYAALLSELLQDGRKLTKEERRILELAKELEATKREEGLRGMMGSVVDTVGGLEGATAAEIGLKAKTPPKSTPGGKGKAAKGGKKKKGAAKATVTVTPAGSKKPSGTKHLLGLDQVPRRYRYGANLQPTKKFLANVIKDSNSQDTSGRNDDEDDDEDEDDEENDNALVSQVPTEAQLLAIFEREKARYEREEALWKGFAWASPGVHESLTRVVRGLDEDERLLRSWILEMRNQPRPPAYPVGLAANGTSPSSTPHYADLVGEDDERDTIEIVRVEEVPADPSSDDDDYVDGDGDGDGDGDSDSDNDSAGDEAETGDAVIVEEVDSPDLRLREPLRKTRRLYGDNDAASALKRKRAKFERVDVPDKGSLRKLNPHDFVGGSLVKWGALMQEQREELGGVCRGNKWLEDYKMLHEQMLSGERPAKLISYSCERSMNCGGLGDRILGMTSAFFFGLVTNRAFLAEWQTPIPLDVVFDAPFIDWSFSSFTLDRHPILSNQSLQEAAADLDIIHFDRASIDATFGTVGWNPDTGTRLTKGMEMRDLAFVSPWIKLFTNRGMIYRSFSYGHLQDRLAQLGLKPLTAFSCILNYLFQPKPAALNFISEYTSVLSLPSVFSIGIQIRTGDASMKDPDYDATNTVEAYKNFFKCAEQLADTYALPDQNVVYYLVTDSAHLREDAQKKFSNKIIVSGAGIEHIHVKSGHVDGVQSAVLESWILAKTDYRVITQDSGFGKVATFAGGTKSTTVTIFPTQNLDVVGLLNKKSRVKVDCRLESAFSSFDELASEWSLG